VKLFVSYAHPQGFGSSVIDVSAEIRSAADIEEIKACIIEHTALCQVVVLWWQRLEVIDPTPDGDGLQKSFYDQP